MSKEKNRSGCFGTLLKLVAVVFLLGILAAIFAPKNETVSHTATSAQTASTSQERPQEVPVATPAQPTPPSFDILGVNASELPKTTKLTEAINFSIAEGKGSTTAPAGSQVNVVSRTGDQIEIVYLDGRQSVSYTKTTIETEIIRSREDAQKRETERIAREEQAKKEMEASQKAAADKVAGRKALVEKHFSSWDGSHDGLTKYIKKNMNDPKSYKHEETRFADKGDYILVQTSFRGKNAFGGLVLNTVIAKCDFDGNVIEIISQK